jgi:urease accessory protein
MSKHHGHTDMHAHHPASHHGGHKPMEHMHPAHDSAHHGGHKPMEHHAHGGGVHGAGCSCAKCKGGRV